MKKQSVFAVAYAEVKRPMRLIAVLLLGVLLSALYPTDLPSYPMLPAHSDVPESVSLTENYVRFIPTLAQVALPLVLSDRIGMVQLLYVAVSGTIATHGTKFLLNNRSILHTRLGQRPNHRDYNMPSGHSSMSSCAVYFVWRRYSRWLGCLLAAIMAMTMYARVMLNAHTISAVLAGALVGIICAALFTSPWRPEVPDQV